MKWLGHDEGRDGEKMPTFTGRHWDVCLPIKKLKINLLTMSLKMGCDRTKTHDETV